MFRTLAYTNFVLSFLLFGFYYYRRKRQGFGTQFILPFIFLVTASDLYELIAVQLFAIKSAVHYKVYSLLEFYILAWYFFNLCNRKLKVLYAAFSAAFFLLFIYACWVFTWDFSESLLTDSYLVSFETVFVYSCAIHWFTSIFKYLPETSLLKLPDFYFVSGLIIYLSGPLFLLLLSSEIISADPSSFREYWILNLVFNIILRLFLIIGIWKIKK